MTALPPHQLARLEQLPRISGRQLMLMVMAHLLAVWLHSWKLMSS